jgi:hypothetical protein
MISDELKRASGAQSLTIAKSVERDSIVIQALGAGQGQIAKLEIPRSRFLSGDFSWLDVGLELNRLMFGEDPIEKAIYAQQAARGEDLCSIRKTLSPEPAITQFLRGSW